MHDSVSMYQDEIAEWIHWNFPTPEKRDELTVIAGLNEEVGEVSRAAVKMRQGIRGTREEWLAELEKEIGDVFVKLVDVADFYGFDLLEAIEKRWVSVSQRNWQEDSIGHGISEDEAA